MFRVPEVRVLLTTVCELEQGLEIVELLVISDGKQLGADLVLGEEALLDDLGHVGAGELEAVGKAGLNL
ncbi:hypothetical protein D9M72_368430 [compost metagenome]